MTSEDPNFWCLTMTALSTVDDVRPLFISCVTIHYLAWSSLHDTCELIGSVSLNMCISLKLVNIDRTGNLGQVLTYY